MNVAVHCILHIFCTTQWIPDWTQTSLILKQRFKNGESLWFFLLANFCVIGDTALVVFIHQISNLERWQSRLNALRPLKQAFLVFICWRYLYYYEATQNINKTNLKGKRITLNSSWGTSLLQKRQKSCIISYVMEVSYFAVLFKT